MNALPVEAKEKVLTGRALLVFVLVAVCALSIRKAMTTFGVAEPWSWAAFGAVLFGGQALAINQQSGGFRRHPFAAALYVVAVVCVGAAFGYWMHS